MTQRATPKRTDIETETFSIRWAEDAGRCSTCGSLVDHGPVGWRDGPAYGRLCDACLGRHHSGLALVVASGATATAGENRPIAGEIAPLTPADVAALVDEKVELTHDTIERLRHLVRSSPCYAGELARLDALATDADLNEDRDDRLSAGLMLHLEFRSLLNAPSWQHPAEVLDPQGVIGISYEALLSIAEALLPGCEDPEALTEVRRKLEQAWDEEKAQKECVGLFVERLLEADPEDAERLLRRAKREYRFLARQSRASAEPVAQTAEAVLSDA